MPGYDFLQGVRVLEVAWLGPSSLGGYLADLGAEVIKVEGHEGDPLRDVGSPAVGSPEGPGLLHLRWNRGKHSVGLNLKLEEGRQLFRSLAATADVLIEGVRAGMLERLGLGFEVLRRSRPGLVFCSLSGLGRSGPYHALPSHAPAFDAFAGIAALNPYALPTAERQRLPYAPVGMHALGLYAATAVLAALHRARQTGQGALVEITGAEAAAHWLPDGVNAALNPDRLFEREPPFKDAQGRMLGWPRLHAYDTADGRAVFLQALSPKFWSRFCAAVGRTDLDPRVSENAAALSDDALHEELATLFRQRSFETWMTLFLAQALPGTPVNDLAQLARDPHFLARDNLYETSYRGVPLTLTSTPIKTPGQAFSPAPAPERWADTQSVLARVLGLSAAEIRQLAERQVVLMSAPQNGIMMHELAERTSHDN